MPGTQLLRPGVAALGLLVMVGCVSTAPALDGPPPPLLRSGGAAAGGARAGITPARPVPARAATPGAAAARPAPDALCPDADRDRICDADDRCRLEGEDRDGFEDEDGCPDLDNDRDGVPDDEDQCPDQPRLLGRQGGPSWLPGERGCPDRFISVPMGTR